MDPLPQRHRRWLSRHLLILCSAALFTGVCSFCPSVLGQTEARVSVFLAPLATRALSRYKGHESQTLHERTAAIFTGTHRYAIRYLAGYDPRKPGRAFPLEGYIGMPGPNTCNWYHGGFLRLVLNGKDIGNAPLSSMYVAETGTRGIVDLVWSHDLADVRVRFIGLPDSDRIYCEIALEPRQELTEITVRTRCYPSYFTSHFKRVGARRIQTSGIKVKEGESIDAPASDSWWMVYYDEVFDVARGEGHGPCAMLIDPAEASSTRFAPGGYAVETLVRYRPDARRLHLAFWDFKGKTNAYALAYFRRDAHGLLQAMREIETTPEAVRSFDIDALREECSRAVANASVRARLGDKLAQVTAWLENRQSSSVEGMPTDGIRGEEQFFLNLRKFRSFSWQLRLAELLVAIEGTRQSGPDPPRSARRKEDGSDRPKPKSPAKR